MTIMNTAIQTDVTALLKDYALPSPLGFGRELAPIMYRADYMNGTWQPGRLIPFGEVEINPAAFAGLPGAFVCLHRFLHCLPMR